MRVRAATTQSLALSWLLWSGAWWFAHPTFTATGKLGPASHPLCPGSQAPCPLVASINIKHVSIQAPELDKRALNELGKLVLSALSQSSPTLPCSSRDSPAGLLSGWAREQGSREVSPSRGSPSAPLYLRWVEAPQDRKGPPGEFTGITEKEAGHEALEGLVGAQ